MPERILITGGAGFIGYGTANKLASDGHSVRVLDNLIRQVHANPGESLSRLHPAVEFVCGDVRDPSEVKASLEGIDVVYHFAAETGVGQSMYEIGKYFSVNVQGTAVLCDCIAKGKGNIRKLILSSSRAVYGEGAYKCKNCDIVYPERRTLAQLKKGEWDLVCPTCGNHITPIPCNETAKLQPVSMYGLSKKVQEDLVKMYSATYQLPVVILRYFNVFGPGQNVLNPYTGVLTIFSSLLIANNDIEIYEDGQMQRDFVSIEEVVAANIKAIEIDVSGTLSLNIGTGEPKTILQLAKFLRDEIDSKSNINITGRFRIGDIRHCFADALTKNEFLGNTTSKNFQYLIKNLVAWVRNEEKGVVLEKSIAELRDFGLTGIATSSQT
jgi:dTDP-L-rhamnose 4-epimerase